MSQPRLSEVKHKSISAVNRSLGAKCVFFATGEDSKAKAASFR
jgi:hypothetical protein